MKTSKFINVHKFSLEDCVTACNILCFHCSIPQMYSNSYTHILNFTVTFRWYWNLSDLFVHHHLKHKIQFLSNVQNFEMKNFYSGFWLWEISRIVKSVYTLNPFVIDFSWNSLSAVGSTSIENLVFTTAIHFVTSNPITAFTKHTMKIVVQ